MSHDIRLDTIKKIFFSGIGGIGISAAARILNQQGKIVVGSDAVRSEITDQLEEEGIEIHIPQSADVVPEDADLFVHTVAVPEDNPERQIAKKWGIPQITYPQLLGLLMAHKRGIGISGTNGKTTTTCMAGLIFMAGGLDPTVVVGGKTEHFGGNSRIGLSDYFIFESDEYRRAFDNYQPMMAVITYITADHFDYYKDIEDIKSAFRSYVERVPQDGYVFINADDKNSMEISDHCQAQRITFGIDATADIAAKNISVSDGEQTFSLYYFGKLLGTISLKVPARYNIYNALAAVGPALTSGIPFETVRDTLESFKGSWRRFERMGKIGRTDVIADYAHTPDAIAKTVSALKEFYPGKKCLVIFQPHQYNRTKNFFKEFAASFAGADRVVILDIYYVVGRENPADFDIDAEKLTAAIIKNGVDASYGDGLSFEQLESIISLPDYDVMLIAGAGDIYNAAKKMIVEHEEKISAEEEALQEKFDETEKPNIKIGQGFSHEKKIIEENKYYSTSPKKKGTIIDKRKKK